MRTTLDRDDDLWREVTRRVDAPSTTALVELALRALLREAARDRLIASGGTMPDLEVPARRRLP
jgi:Arc/MetJ family transcription regulator